MKYENTTSLMLDYYNEIEDSYDDIRQYLTRKDLAWYSYIKNHLNTLHLLDEKVYYCFECGYYPPTEGNNNE